MRQKPNLDDVKLTSYREIVNVIKSLKNNKATGYDQIGARVIKNLPRKAIVFMVKIVNGIFCTSHFPTSWKISKIVPVYKKKKDVTQIANYRPISLLPTLSKIIEKIIKMRLEAFLEANQILVSEQFGFRRGHSTTDQLARLVNLITVNFNKKMHTGALLMNIESAFPTVWHTGIIFKMIQYNFPRCLIFLIWSYLDKRVFVLTLALSNHC